jgi:hypothetical protein
VASYHFLEVIKKDRIGQVIFFLVFGAQLFIGFCNTYYNNLALLVLVQDAVDMIV